MCERGPKVHDKIIQVLKKASGYVSGEDISSALKVSRAAIWKYMHSLKGMGYEINAVPHLGYQLLSVPDRLFPWEIKDGLKTNVFGHNVIYHETVRSTMDDAFQLGLQGACEGTIVCAESQTKGRGRLGRQWISPKHKGIYFSIILRPNLPPSEIAELTLLAAVAVCDAIRDISGLNIQIKWPNDILYKGKKLGGILTELNAELDRVKFALVGIGLNVNTGEHQLLETATSLRKETGQNYLRVDILKQILFVMEQCYQQMLREGSGPIIARWKELSLTLGRKIKVLEVNGVMEGEAIDLAKDGGLMIRCPNGDIIKKMSGDVVLDG